MADAVDIDVIDFEDEYDKADPIGDVNLDESINELNRSIREQEDLENRIRRTEWSSRMKMNEQNWNNRQLLTRRNGDYTS